MRKWIVQAVIVLLAVGSGCTQVSKEEMQQRLDFMEKVADIAERHGAAGSITFHWRGEGRGYVETAAGADLGISASGNLQFNAAATSRPAAEEPLDQ